MATYAKGLARRASLTEVSARAAKSYKAKVASLTSERADLQAHIRELTEELVKHRSDLKHASVARAWAKDKERRPGRKQRSPKTSCGWPERSCKPLRVTYGPRWWPYSGPAKRLWRCVTLWNA